MSIDSVDPTRSGHYRFDSPKEGAEKSGIPSPKREESSKKEMRFTHAHILHSTKEHAALIVSIGSLRVPITVFFPNQKELRSEQVEAIQALSRLFPELMEKICAHKEISPKQLAQLSIVFSWIKSEMDSKEDFLANHSFYKSDVEQIKKQTEELGIQLLERVLLLHELPFPILREALYRIPNDPTWKANKSDFIALFDLPINPTSVMKRTAAHAFTRVLGSAALKALELSESQRVELLKLPIEQLQVLHIWMQDNPSFEAQGIIKVALSLLGTEEGQKKLDAMRLPRETRRDALIQILEMSTWLISNNLEAMPILLNSLRDNPSFFTSLFILSKKLSSDAFNQLIGNYFTPNDPNSILTRPFIEKAILEYSPADWTAFQRLIEREREVRNPLMPLLLDHPELLHKPLFNALLTDRQFAMQMDANHWTQPSFYATLDHCFELNTPLAIDFFAVADQNNDAIHALMLDLNRRSASSASTSVIRLYQSILKLRQEPASMNTAKALMVLIGQGKAELGERIMGLQEGLRTRLLSLVLHGEVSLIVNLFRPHTDDQLLQRLRAQVNETNISLIKGILRCLQDNSSPELIKFLAEKNPNAPFTAAESNALLLHLQGYGFLLDGYLTILSKPVSARSQQEEQLLLLISQHRFSFANDFLRQSAGAETASDASSAEYAKIAIDLEARLKKVHDQNPRSRLIGISIAEAIVNASGAINYALLSALIETPFIRDGDPYLKRVLLALQSDPHFSNRLESLQSVPAPGSRQNSLLKSLMGLPDSQEPTRRHAQCTVLSALLWPMRQSSSWSCFGTAVAIQTDSSTEGLKQSLEDYLALVAHGALTRSRGQTRVTYPMSFEAGRFQTAFGDDNFLARAREFTLATMSGPPPELADSLQRLRKICTEQLGRHALPAAKVLGGDRFSPMIQSIFERMQPRFLGYIRQTNGRKQGAWLVVDARTERPLIASREDFQGFFMRAWEDEMTRYQNLHAKESSELRDAIRQIKESYMKYLSSDQFLKDFFQVSDISSIPFGFNPETLSSNPLVSFQGGYPNSILAIYQPGSTPYLRTLPPHSDPLSRIYHYCYSATSHEKAVAETEPLAKTFVASNHAMTLRVGRLMQAMGPSADPAAYTEQLRKAYQALYDMPLTPQLQKEILSSYQKELHNLDLELLSRALQASIPPPRTLQAFLQLLYRSTLLISTHPKIENLAKSALHKVLWRIKELQDGLPAALPFVDTNWQTIPFMAFWVDFSGETVPYFCNEQGEPVISGMRPWPLSEWQMVQVNVVQDEHSLVYTQP